MSRGDAATAGSRPASSRSSTAPGRSSTPPTRPAAGAEPPRAAISSGTHVRPQRRERRGVAEPRRLVGGQRLDDADAVGLLGTGRARRVTYASTSASPASRASGSSRLSTRYSLPGASWIALRRRTRSATKANDSGLTPSGHPASDEDRPLPAQQALDVGATSRERQHAVREPGGRDRAGHPPHDARRLVLDDDGAAGVDDVAGSRSRPSAPMPVSTTPSSSPPNARTAERNSTSTDGRQKFTGGPSVSTVRDDGPAPLDLEVPVAGGDVDGARAAARCRPRPRRRAPGRAGRAARRAAA